MTEEFVPTYERWRHGGWYVTNVDYPDGAVGCVSNNYPDGKWRIVCGSDEHITFPSRDAAARAEYAVVEALKAQSGGKLTIDLAPPMLRRFVFISKALGYPRPEDCAEEIINHWLQTVKRFPGWHENRGPDRKTEADPDVPQG